MEDFLYPTGGLAPKVVGLGFCDYMLSDVVKSHGYALRFVQFNTSNEGPYSAEVQVCNGDDMVWHGHLAYYRNGERPECELQRCRDIMVRYYGKGGKMERPVWVDIK